MRSCDSAHPNWPQSSVGARLLGGGRLFNIVAVSTGANVERKDNFEKVVFLALPKCTVDVD